LGIFSGASFRRSVFYQPGESLPLSEVEGNLARTDARLTLVRSVGETARAPPSLDSLAFRVRTPK